MSILGNQEAPKALVIVPWKSSELGNWPERFDDARRLEASPIDKEVFMRMLSYYEIRSETARPSGAPTNGNATAPATRGAKEEAMSLTELLGNVGLFGGAVMVCLALLSIFSVGMIVDKQRRFRSASRQSEEFKPEFKKFMHGGDIQESDRSRTAAPEFPRGAGGLGGHRSSTTACARADAIRSPRSSSSRAHSRDSMSETLIQLKRGLGFLATIGSMAPFIGLFGTVVGIINAFRSIAATGSGGMSVVSGGIAEALVSTALGIFVAIPAVVAFNHFTGKIETFHVEMNRASSQLVNCLFKMPELKALDVEMAEVKAPMVKKGGPAYAAR